MSSYVSPSLFDNSSAIAATKRAAQNPYALATGKEEPFQASPQSAPAPTKPVRKASTTAKVPTGYLTPSTETEVYLTAIQVAQRLSIGKATVWRWTKYNDGFPNPVRFTNGATRWRLSDLMAFETRALMGA